MLLLLLTLLESSAGLLCLTGIFYGNGIAKLSIVYPIQVKKSADSKKIISFDDPQILEKSDLDNPLVFSELG